MSLLSSDISFFPGHPSVHRVILNNEKYPSRQGTNDRMVILSDVMAILPGEESAETNKE